MMKKLPARKATPVEAAILPLFHPSHAKRHDCRFHETPHTKHHPWKRQSCRFSTPLTQSDTIVASTTQPDNSMNKKPKIAALTPGKDFVFFDPNKHIDMRRSNLPHWQQDNCLYFVTFRLADSIPSIKLQNWNSQHRSWLSRNPKPWSRHQAEEYLNHFKHKVERWLDQSHGTCLLKNKELKKLWLSAWSIMTEHGIRSTATSLRPTMCTFL